MQKEFIGLNYATQHKGFRFIVLAMNKHVNRSYHKTYRKSQLTQKR